MNQLSDLKMGLTFAGVEKASPTLKMSKVDIATPAIKLDNEEGGSYSSESHTAAAFKPSDVIELQKQVSPSVTKQQRRNGVESDLIDIGESQGKWELSAGWPLNSFTLYTLNLHA